MPETKLISGTTLSDPPSLKLRRGVADKREKGLRTKGNEHCQAGTHADDPVIQVIPVELDPAAVRMPVADSDPAFHSVSFLSMSYAEFLVPQSVLDYIIK